MSLIKKKTINIIKNNKMVKSSKSFQTLIRYVLILSLMYSCSSSYENDEILIEENEIENEFEEIQFGVNEYGITYQGLDRDFIVYVPESYSHESSSSVVFVYHGFGGSNDQIMYYSDFNTISERENFIIVYPQGSNFWGYPHWNVGGWTNSSTTDDISLTEFLIELISQEYNINQEKIYATGMSNGGFFSFLLACQSSEKFAAVASVTGSMTIETFNNCNPQREVPVLQLHGTQDPIVQYYGNSSIGSIGISEAISYWRTNNYCSNDPIVSQLNDSNPNDNFWVEKILYDDGYNGSVVEHYKIYGGEHVWFNNQDINSSELIWEFFSKYDLNGFIN